MRFNDAVVGAALLLFSITLMIHVSVGWDWIVETGFEGFPRAVPGKPGPALFPFTLGILFAATSLVLLARGMKDRSPWLTLQPWIRNRAGRRNAIAIVVAVLVYQYLSDLIGFLPLATVLLFALMKLLQVRTGTAALVSVLCVLFIHTLFVKFLLVPLPWGVLEPLAW